MSTISNHQMVEGVSQQIRAIETEAHELEKLQRGIGADRARIEREIDSAWSELAEVLLPSLDPAVLDGAARALRSPALAHAEVQRRMRETFANNQNRLAKLAAEPMVRDREALLNANQIRFAEVNDAAAAIDAGLAPLESNPNFTELLAYRYGTPEYTVRFWQLSFYSHWKNADLIVEAHGGRVGATDFAGIAAKYVEEKAAWRQLEATKKVLMDEEKAITALAKQVFDLEYANQNLVAHTLATLRGRVRSQLEPLADRDLASVLQGVPAAEQVFKRIAGLKKKHEYLASLAENQVKSPLSELKAMEQKLRHERNKLLRPKNSGRRWAQADYQRRFGNDRVSKWQKRRERIHNTRTHIVEYHHYDRWDPYGDFLWWDLMSDGQLDGNFIDEVRSRPHHVHHMHSHSTSSSALDVDTGFADVS